MTSVQEAAIGFASHLREGDRLSVIGINDSARTLHPLDTDVKGKLKTGADKSAAVEVGKLIAARAIAAGVKEVVFDRGGYMYHGRVAALANAAREGGLSF